MMYTFHGLLKPDPPFPRYSLLLWRVAIEVAVSASDHLQFCIEMLASSNLETKS